MYVAVANSLVLDFVARQRVLGKTLALNILDSLPIARVQKLDEVGDWLTTAALLLTCTSEDMDDLWKEQAAEGWNPPTSASRGLVSELGRRILRARTDAVVARYVYELSRADVELILGAFPQLEGIEMKRHGEFLTARLVLEAFDAAEAGLPDFEDVL